MMRNLADLKRECDKNGLKYSAKPSKEELEILLRDFYWERDHKGEVMPPQIEVMLAQKLRDLDEDEAEKIWASDSWTAEEKLDGCRLIMVVDKFGSARFFSRNKSVKDFLYDEKTANLPFHAQWKFPELAGAILDGEILSTIACADTGGTKTNNALTTCSAIINAGPEVALNFQNKYGPFKYVIFDVLREPTADGLGKDVSQFRFYQRRMIRHQVAQCLYRSGDTLFGEVNFSDQKKLEFYTAVVMKGGEGVMLKDMDAPYEFGKRRWTLLKAKRFDDYDAFVTGFVPSDPKKGIADFIGALEFSVIDEKTGKTKVIGSVSSMPLEFRKWATKNPGPNCGLNPELLHSVAVIRGQEFSSKNLRLKHCTFAPGTWEQPVKNGDWLGYFRKDKRPEDCKIDLSFIAEKVEKGERV